MADAQFFPPNGPFPLSRIVELTDVSLQGATADTARLFNDVAPLETAGADHISFFDNVKYIEAFRATKAGACFVRTKFAPQAPASLTCLVTEDPYSAYALTAQLFYPEPAVVPTIS